jgi:[ribosomal protein S18]-alanine N-acetyltransferase
MKFQIRPLKKSEAEAMLSWRYEPPYDMYNIISVNEEEDVRFFTNPQNNYYAMLDVSSDFVGFCCYGVDARVPGGDYSLEALDIGMGMRPNLTGQGRGSEFARAALDHALKIYHPDFCRVTIAGINQRARRVWENLGFKMVQTFQKSNSGMEFVIMTAAVSQLAG